ncbi:hypothetical protein OE810_00260 [Rhodobacteraceae bacterium XHP0102]|nr:hypothetical protein [Rhodobacteraceae bacterium XHP0102]
MIRPELRVLFLRYAETILAACVAGVALWLITRPSPILAGVGWVVLVLALITGFVALRRARFASTGQGAGVVRLVEGRIAYMGPVWGGAVDLDDLQSLALRKEADQGLAWVLKTHDRMLAIPLDAQGAEVLVDGFAALPKLSVAALIAARDKNKEGTHILWTRGLDTDGQAGQLRMSVQS